MEEYKNKGYGQNVLGVSEGTFYSFIYYGKLGELVFRDLLKAESIQNECNDILVPFPGKFKRNGSDFVLTGTNETIYVKTVEASYKTRLLVREDQFRAKQHDLYVGQRTIDGANVECWGYVTKEELSEIVPTEKFGFGPCRFWSLRDLHPIEDFINKAKKGESCSGTHLE